MNFEQKIQEMNNKMFDILSTKEISFLNDLDTRIKIIKDGKFKYYKMLYLELDDIKNFLNNLDHDKIYTLIPFISVNNRSDEPYTVLSRQILITRNSKPVLINNYANNKINKAFELFNSDIKNSYYTIFKYKQVKINFKEFSSF